MSNNLFLPANCSYMKILYTSFLRRPTHTSICFTIIMHSITFLHKKSAGLYHIFTYISV